VPAIAGELLGGGQQGCSDAMSAMVGVHADLLNVRIAIEHLQPDEADRPIPRIHRDQEPAVIEGGAVDVRSGRRRAGNAVHTRRPELLLP
jgi:hypothetical protein